MVGRSVIAILVAGLVAGCATAPPARRTMQGPAAPSIDAARFERSSSRFNQRAHAAPKGVDAPPALTGAGWSKAPHAPTVEGISGEAFRTVPARWQSLLGPLDDEAMKRWLEAVTPAALPSKPAAPGGAGGPSSPE